jgi:DNA-directed RNA polymerase subunit F
MNTTTVSISDRASNCLSEISKEMGISKTTLVNSMSLFLMTRDKDQIQYILDVAKSMNSLADLGVIFTYGNEVKVKTENINEILSYISRYFNRNFSEKQLPLKKV